MFSMNHMAHMAESGRIQERMEPGILHISPRFTMPCPPPCPNGGFSEVAGAARRLSGGDSDGVSRPAPDEGVTSGSTAG